MKPSIFAGLLLMALGSTAAFAEEAEKTPKPIKKSTDSLTVDQRSKMASFHEKMATCLRSDRPLEDCRAEMRSSCMQLGKGACPMGGMGMGGMMGGKGPGKMRGREKMPDPDKMQHDHSTMKSDGASE